MLLLHEHLQWLQDGHPAESYGHQLNYIQVISATRWQARMLQVVLYHLYTDNTNIYMYCVHSNISS